MLTITPSTLVDMFSFVRTNGGYRRLMSALPLCNIGFAAMFFGKSERGDRIFFKRNNITVILFDVRDTALGRCKASRYCWTNQHAHAFSGELRLIGVTLNTALTGNWTHPQGYRRLFSAFLYCNIGFSAVFWGRSKRENPVCINRNTITVIHFDVFDTTV